MKIRLHGTLDEVKDGIERLKNIFQVVSVSNPYKDRGESELYRVYVDVRM